VQIGGIDYIGLGSRPSAEPWIILASINWMDAIFRWTWFDASFQIVDLLASEKHYLEVANQPISLPENYVEPYEIPWRSRVQ